MGLLHDLCKKVLKYSHFFLDKVDKGIYNI